MAMSRWTCGHDGCKSRAFGAGGPVGLRALGWYVHLVVKDEKGPVILCPAHRPDPIRCTQIGSAKCRQGSKCSQCAARKQALVTQAMITRAVPERVYDS